MMTRSLRAPVTRMRTLATIVVCTLGAAGGIGAQNGSDAGLAQYAPDGEPPKAHTYRRVKVFEFDERPLGNFEDEPMYWRQFRGPGLPFYSIGRIDEQVGHAAPPSFQFVLKGGNIGWEYFRDDLAISPESEYLIECYARAEGLEVAQAFMVSSLVNAAGEVIAGSRRISQTLRPEGDGTAWQRLTIRLAGNPPEAHTLRLELWLLQDYAWQEPSESAPDPIVRQDVDARVWFDDIAIYRMPRIQLQLSNPGGIIAPGATEGLEIDVHNATLALLKTTLSVVDADGREVMEEVHNIGPETTRNIRTPVPTLEPGLYEATVRLGTESETLLQRSVRFAVLPELGNGERRDADLGLDLGRWRGGSLEGAIDLVTTLQCGAVKIGETAGTPDDQRHIAYLGEIRDLARLLVINTIETTGVILPPELDAHGSGIRSTYEMVRSHQAWDNEAGPGFAYLGDLIFSWQLGAEEVELQSPEGWTIASIEEVRYKLERFVAVPSLVVPRSIFDTTPTRLLPELINGASVEAVPERPLAVDWSDTPRRASFTGRPLADPALPHAYSFLLPKTLPAQAFPWQLAFWFEPDTDRDFEDSATIKRRPDMRDPEHWLTVGLDRDSETLTAERVADAARRIVLAKAVNPDRIYVSAPFELAETGGTASWQPTDLYIPLRTLFHYIGGRRAAAALRLQHNSVGVLFSRGDHSSLVIWTQEVESEPAVVELYVGGAAYGVHLSGEPEALEFDGLRARIPLSPTPLIIDDIDAPLLLLQHSFDIRPAFIQLHDPEPRPVLMLRNVYDSQLSGTIDLHAPESWQVSPNPIALQLQPGSGLAETLYFTIPPRQIATEETIGVEIHVRRPEMVDLQFDVPVRIELRDILVKTSAWWDGDTLVVEQSMRNLSQDAVSFTAFCQAPGRSRREGVFLNVVPGGYRVQAYRFEAARGIAGSRLWTGIEELDGRRSLDQLVAIPP